MKKLLIIITITILLPSCAKLFQEGGTISSDGFIYLGEPTQDYCESNCEKYAIKKYNQIDIDKPFVIVDDRKYIEPWCFCMEFCLRLDEPYCSEDSTSSN